MPADFATSGWLMKAAADGTLEPVADVAAFETEDDPDAAWGGSVDSNPYGIAVADGGIAVADADSNDVLLVGDDGSVALIAAIPFTTHESSAAALEAMGGLSEGEAAGEAPRRR
jgi:hypothetical protein